MVPNMSTRTSLWLLLCSAILMACFPQPPDYTGGGPGTPDANTGNPCDRQSAGSGEGFPFDVTVFDDMIQPALMTNNCQVGGGCHGPGNANEFTIFTEGECPEIQTFNEVFRLSSYQQGATASRMVQAINGMLASHPVKPPGTDALVTLLTDYIDTAKATYEAGGGGGGGGFDPEVFASDIQDILDDGGCLASCHNTTNRFGEFGLTPMPFGSADLEANFQAVLTKIETTLTPDQATMATLYVKATTAHGGSTPITNATDLSTLESWIADGLTSQ